MDTVTPEARTLAERARWQTLKESGIHRLWRGAMHRLMDRFPADQEYRVSLYEDATTGELIMRVVPAVDAKA